MKNREFVILPLLSIFGVIVFLISYIANGDWVAPPEADKIKNPIAGAKPNGKVENRFTSNCAMCHGNYGKGDGFDGKRLNPKPTDLTTEAVQRQTDGAIFWKISNGRGTMLSYKNTFNETERWELVNFVRSLGKNRNSISYDE